MSLYIVILIQYIKNAKGLKILLLTSSSLQLLFNKKFQLRILLLKRRNCMGQCCAAKKVPDNRQSREITTKKSKQRVKTPENLPDSYTYTTLYDLHIEGYGLSGLIKNIESKYHDDIRTKYLQIGNVYFLEKQYFKAYQSYYRSVEADRAQHFWGYGGKQQRSGMYEGKVQEWYYEKVKSQDFIESGWNGLALSILQLSEQTETIENQLIKLLKEKQHYQIEMVLGHFYYNHSDYEKALENYCKADESSQSNIYAMLGKANSYLRLKKMEQSCQEFDKILQLDPQSVYALVGKSKLFIGSHKEKQYLEKASQCDGKYAKPFNNLGNYYFYLKQYHQAKFYYKKSIEINDKYCAPIYGLGNTHKALKDTEEAIQCFQNCLQLNPKDIESYINLGHLYKNSKDYDNAKQNFNRAISLNSKAEGAYNGLGNIYTLQKKNRQAIQCYLKSIQINPKQCSLYNNLGILYSDMQNYDEAINSYTKAIKNNPKSFKAYNNLGIIYNNLNKSEQAIKIYQKCIEINPNYEVAYNGLGNVYKKIKQYNEAIRYYGKAIQIKEDYSSPHNGLGGVYKQLREFHKAISCYQKCIELNQINPLYDLNLAMAYIEIQNYGQAFQTFKKCQQKLNGSHGLQNIHIQFIKNSISNFKQQAEQWEHRIKIGFVSNEQKKKIRQMKEEFEKRYEKLFSSESRADDLSPETVLNPRFLKVCRIIFQSDLEKQQFADIAAQIYEMFKENYDAFQIMAQVICNWFWSKRFLKDSGTTSEIEVRLAQIMKHLCGQFSPTQERQLIKGIQFPAQAQKKINLFTSTQFFSSYQGVVNEIQRLNEISKKVKPKFAKIVYDTEYECSGFNCKAGLKLPDNPEKWFKVIIRIMEKMFKEIKGEKENLMHEIQQKISKFQEPSMLKIMKIIMEVWINKIDQILKHRKKEKIPTQCHLSDLVRGKCLFKSPENIKSAAQFIVKYCQRQDYEITEIDNRINKVTHDVVFKILIDGIVCEFQLALQFDQIKFEYGHSFYEIDRSPLGCIFGSYLILAKGTEYSFYSRIKDAISLLEPRQEIDQMKKQNLEALKFIEQILNKSNQSR